MKSDRRLIAWGGGVLLTLSAIALGADVLAPSNPIEVTDEVAGRYLSPGSRRVEVRLADGSTTVAESAMPTARGLEIVRLGAKSELSADNIMSVKERVYLLGTDRFGRDLLSRLIYGARISLGIGVGAGLLGLLFGVFVGAVAASAGGLTDAVLMRLTDALLAFPQLFLVIVVVTLFEASGTLVALILGLTGWMATARLIRAEILTLRRRDFVLAASAVGSSPATVLLRHLLPNALTPVIAFTALRVGDLILVEASLSFLGLGVTPPQPTWGNMIHHGSAALTNAWWVAAFPGLAIALTVVSLHLLGDGLRAWLDPRS